jgi:type IV pilus assembly protein PilC
MKFAYRGFDRAGKAKAEIIEAATAAEAAELLQREGLFIADLKPADDAQPAAAGSSGGRSKGGRIRNVAAFMRHLSVLVSTGTPVVEALGALERQARDESWRAVITDVRARVEDGLSFSDALAAHPRYFDTVCRSLVRAGESGGDLSVMLQRLADLTRQSVKVRQTLIGALVYPCLLIVVAIVVLAVMMWFVLPRFTGLFTTLGAPLPPTTKVLMGISEFMVAYWWAILGILAASTTGVVMWLRTPGGRRGLHTAMIRTPHIGRVFRSIATARFARIMGLLLQSKVPMLECLELTQQSCSNIHYAELLARAQESLTRGEPFSGAIASGGLISDSVREAVRNAERTGQVGPVLSSMADFLEEENEVIVKSLTGLLEPLILISLGLIVGFVAISMFMPLFDLTATAGGGGPP